MKGRPGKSNEMKRLNGTDQPCRMKVENEGILPLESIAVPKVLKTASAKRIFKEKAEQLISIRALTALDVDMLIVWAQTEDIVLECIKGMRGEKFITLTKGFQLGSGKKGAVAPIGFKSFDEKLVKVKKVPVLEGKVIGYVVSPWMKLYKDNVELLAKLAMHFGFSPAARTKMYANIGEGKKKNKFEGF